jgi:hypothetical protein
VTPLSDCNGAAGYGPSFGTYEKSKVESQKHKDDANIHYQSFPESISEETEIYTDYDGYHRHHIKHYSYPSIHFGSRSWGRLSWSPLSSAVLLWAGPDDPRRGADRPARSRRSRAGRRSDVDGKIGVSEGAHSLTRPLQD